MKTTWMVTKGQYSDYTVLCVCDSKQRAKRVASLYNESDGSRWGGRAVVEKVRLIDREPETVTIYTMRVNVWDDGTTDEEGETARSEWEFDLLYPERAKPVGWRWVRAGVHHNRGGRLEVYGTDLERVRRVFSDKRAELLALDATRLREQAHG